MKRSIFFVMTLTVCALLSGCSLDPLSSHLTTQPPESPTYLPVSPSADGLTSEKQTATLYFGFRDEGMLSTESREIQTSLDERVEQCVIEELIKGPSANHTELTALIPANVRVMNIEDREGILFVTLSGEFLDKPGDAPDNWSSDAYWSKEVPRRRLLALKSIACAITDMGKYDQVQLLIDSDGEGDKSGQRVPRAYFYGDTRKDQSVTLDPIKRDESAVLTPRNTVFRVLSLMQSKSWEELYQYIAPVSGNIARPAADEFSSTMQTAAFTMTGFSVGDSMVTGDGQSATVCCDVQFTFKDESTRNAENFPLRLTRDGEVWKLAYSSLSGLLGG